MFGIRGSFYAQQQFDMSGRSWITGYQSRQSDLSMLLGKLAGLRVEIDGDVLIDTLSSGQEGQSRETGHTAHASAPTARPAPNTLQTLDDLRNASPGQLARMTRQLKKQAPLRGRR